MRVVSAVGTEARVRLVVLTGGPRATPAWYKTIDAGSGSWMLNSRLFGQGTCARSGFADLDHGNIGLADVLAAGSAIERALVG
jgi:hypothetical protein